jgi:hypothetical protein
MTLRKRYTILTLLTILSFLQFQSFGQDNLTTKSTINFYLGCKHCDFNFVRQELNFVSFVRDPTLADVHIMATSSQTGSGGMKYFLNFIGMGNFEGKNLEYKYYAEQLATSDERRNGLLKLIQTGILQYYIETDLFDGIEIDLKGEKIENEVAVVNDPWNLWVFRLSAGSDFEIEEKKNEFSLGTDLRINKVTELWKTELRANHNMDHENYLNDDVKITNSQSRTRISAEYIHSLSPKWSTGMFADYESTTYMNIRNAFKYSVGAEYNIFPWDISNSKIFALRYNIGVQIYDYSEETIYDKLNETLFYESVGLNMEIIQPWGKIEMSLEGRHYFHDFSKNRLIFESDFSKRLSKQISIYFEFNTEIIHDQLYLRKSDDSLEDVLLNRRKLATTYEIGGELGIRFTFGSIYNNVVNERF